MTNMTTGRPWTKNRLRSLNLLPDDSDGSLSIPMEVQSIIDSYEQATDEPDNPGYSSMSEFEDDTNYQLDDPATQLDDTETLPDDPANQLDDPATTLDDTATPLNDTATSLEYRATAQRHNLHGLIDLTILPLFHPLFVLQPNSTRFDAIFLVFDPSPDPSSATRGINNLATRTHCNSNTNPTPFSVLK